MGFFFQKTVSPKDFETLLINWMATKRLPISFFDDDITQNFFRFLNPKIEMPKRNVARRMLLEQFESKQKIIKKILRDNKSKFSFTIDGWSSISSRSYYGVTIHFIDTQWELKSFTLDFIPSHGQHTGKAIAKYFYECLKEYDIRDRIQGITLDNAAANTTFIYELSQLMEESGYKFDPINQHFRCFAHILNLGVQDILKNIHATSDEEYSVDLEETEECFEKSSDIDEDSEEEYLINEDIRHENILESHLFNFSPASIIYKLRRTIIKIRLCEQMQIKLRTYCETNNVKYIKPILDVKTRWHSTFHMLDVGLKLKPALRLLWISFKELTKFQLSEDEWLLLEQIHKFLRNVKIVSDIIAGEKYPTLPLVIVAFNVLVSKIENIIFSLDAPEERNKIDEILLMSYQAGRDKMLKHYRLTNWIYCSVLILDPRHKVEIFNNSEWGREMKSKSIEIFHNIYEKEYCTEFHPPLDSVDEHQNSSLGSNTGIIDIMSVYEQMESDKDCNPWKSELNAYLGSKRCNKNVNILEWWKLNEKEYPTLARMARDLLSITATSVPAERLFSRAKLVITPTRNALNDKSIRVLMCLSSWKFLDG